MENVNFSHYHRSVCGCRSELECGLSKEQAVLLTQEAPSAHWDGQTLTHTMRTIVEADMSSAVVSVCGVLLPRLTTVEAQQVGVAVNISCVQI